MAKTEKVVSRVTRLSKSEKIAKRLKGIDPGTGGIKVTKSEFTATLFMKVPTELNGYLVSEDDHSLVIRHKRTNASKRMVFTSFAKADLLNVYSGGIGELIQVTIMAEAEIATAEGVIVGRTPTSVLLRNSEGSLVSMHEHHGARLVVSCSEETASVATSTKSKGKKKKKSK